MRPGGRSGNTTSRSRRFQHSRRWPNFGSITRKSTPERTLDHWKNHIDSYLTPAFGDYRLDQIDTPAIEKRRLLWRHEDKTVTDQSEQAAYDHDGNFHRSRKTLRKGNQQPGKYRAALGRGSVEASGKEAAEIRPEEIYNAEELNRLIHAAEPGFNNQRRTESGYFPEKMRKLRKKRARIAKKSEQGNRAVKRLEVYLRKLVRAQELDRTGELPADLQKARWATRRPSRHRKSQGKKVGKHRSRHSENDQLARKRASTLILRT